MSELARNRLPEDELVTVAVSMLRRSAEKGADMTLAKLGCLLYLADVVAVRVLGHSLTGYTWIAGTNGPEIGQPVAKKRKSHPKPKKNVKGRARQRRGSK